MKTYLTYGAVIAFASAVLTLVLHILGFLTDPERLGTSFIIAIVLGLVITITGLVLGTKAAREPFEREGFGYGRAFKAGFMIVLASAVLGMVFNFIYFQFINPNFTEISIQWTQSFMERMGAPESQIDAKIEEIRRSSSVTRQIINGVVSSVIMGTLLTLVIAAIMKRAPKEDLTGVPPTV